MNKIIYLYPKCWMNCFRDLGFFKIISFWFKRLTIELNFLRDLNFLKISKEISDNVIIIDIYILFFQVSIFKLCMKNKEILNNE